MRDDAEGYRLGVVLEVGAAALRIELLRPADTEVWVQDEAVFTVDDNRVTLICEN